MSTNPQNAKAIFLEAVEKYTPDQWTAFLEGACGEDHELRQLVENLLQAHQQRDSLFDSPAPTAEYQPLETSGQMIGPYKLRECLGSGGMGMVWAAEQKHPLRRKVALKLIKPGMDSEQVLARFEVEREALALMDHPNIARVLDAGRTDQGRPYFVMELIHGLAMTDYCDAHKLTVRERLSLFVQVCKGVQHAHQKGVIHRDIKPTNVLVTELDGVPVPKIIDFGVAKALHQQLTDGSIYTGVFQAIGTLAYMSPEQATLSPKDIDTRSDVYGLGALLFELLTGSTPFERKQLERNALDEAFRIIREQDAPKPSTKISTLNRDVVALISQSRSTDPAGLGRLIRGDLDWIVMKALEKDRARRYRTADALATDLDRYLSHEPVEARPPSTSYRLLRFYQRNRTVVACSIAAVLFLLVGIFGTTTAWYRAWRSQLAAESAQQRANEEAEARRAQLVLSDGIAIQQLLSENNVGDAHTVIERHKISGDRELGEFEWRYFTRLMKQLERHSQRIELEQQGSFVCFSPDGSQLAVGQLGATTTGGLITLFDTHDWKFLKNFGPKESWVYSMSYSPTGDFLAFGDQNPHRLVVRNLPSGQEMCSSEHQKFVRAIAFSPQGRIIASGGDDEFVLISEATSCAVVHKLPIGRAGVSALTFAPDGSRLATSGFDATIRIWDTTTWEEIDSLELSPVVLGHALSFSPDGSTLACANRQDDVVIRNLATHDEIALRGHRDEVRAVAFSPDGKLIGTGSRDGSVKLWDASTYVELRTLRGHTSFVQSVAFSPDGSQLVSASRDYSFRVWNLEELMAASDCVHPSGTAQDVVFSKSLGGFLSLSGKGNIELWDKETGRSTRALPFPVQDVFRMAISKNDVLALVREKDVLLCDLRQGETVTLDHGGRTPRLHNDTTPAAFSFDDRYFAIACGDGGIQVWDLVTNYPPFCFEKAHFGPASCVAFDPTKRSLVSGGKDGKIHLWDLDRRRCIRTFDQDGHRSEVVCLAYTPDGRVLASASFDNTIKLWDLEDPDATPRTITAHVGPVKTILFSSSGRTLVSAGGDETVRLFDTATGQTKATFLGHETAVCRLAWSDDESVLASADAGEGQSIRFWRAD